MRVTNPQIIDIESNHVDPEQTTEIWCIVTKDIKTGIVRVFTDRESFEKFFRPITHWIGHNILDYDLRVLRLVYDIDIDNHKVLDTLVMSRLDDVRREGGHSLEQWGTTLGFPKGDWSDWSKLSDEMIEYCKRDVELTYRVYIFLKERKSTSCAQALAVEQKMTVICREMSQVGFKFDYERAKELEREICEKIGPLEKEIIESFPPNIIVLKTKTKVTPFNIGSAKQIIDRIHLFWSPVEKTKGYLEAEKDVRHPKLDHFKKYGWKLSEANFATLSDDAPSAAKLFVKYRLYKSRLMKLTEWFNAYNPSTGRLHGTFVSLGTWTGRMVHQAPNMANVAAEKSIKYKTKELKDEATRLGRVMRELFICEEDSWLVGVDAEGIQLRVLAQYINEPEFTYSVVHGKKEDKTDVHSVNCSTICLPNVDRDSAKTFIYAWILGAGLPKIATIFGSDEQDAREARSRFEDRYEGLKKLKKVTVYQDAKRGYFVGFDGRQVPCISPHHMLSGYLQNGEAVVVKHTAIDSLDRIRKAGYKANLISIVHDELLFEVKGTKFEAIGVKEIVEDAFVETGKKLKLNVPIAGKGAVGKNWLQVH